MNKIKKFIVLDFMSIKPYLTLKNMMIFIFLVIILTFSSKSPTSPVMGVLWFTVMFASYPFAVGEQNGIDALYTILGLDRKIVVQGRYGFLLMMNVAAILVSLAVYLLAILVQGSEVSWQESLLAVFAMFMVLTFIQQIQYTMFFKNGYMKAKFATIVPLFILGGMAFFAVQIYGFAPEAFNAFGGFAEKNPAVIILGVLALWFAGLVTSYKLSCKYYEQREF